jgi:hypothetical protein
MSSKTLRTVAFQLFAAILAIASARTAGAEVGVVLVGPVGTAPVRGPYRLGISEDPTPFGSAWYSFSSSPSRVVLNPQGAVNGDGNPAFVLNPVSNTPIVTWSRNNSGHFEVVVSAFIAGAWSTPQVVSASSANELDPSLAVDATGAVHLFYWVDTGATQRVYYTHAPSDLSSWSASIPVSSVGESACRPGAAIHNDTLSVAYESHPGGYGTIPSQVVVADYDGSNFISAVAVTSNNPAELWPAVRAHAGRYWVEWVDSACSTGIQGELGWMRWDSTLSQWQPMRTDPFATTEERDFNVRPGIRLEAVAP